MTCRHPRLQECIVPDFTSLEDFKDRLSGYDACFYCAGISSVGMSEEKYAHITYDTTIQFAKGLLALNPDIIFNFISGSHTDSSEKEKLMWARVKGKTENALMKLPFKGQYNFRPGGMIPTPGQRNAKFIYGIIVKIIRALAPKRVNTLNEVGLAMINATLGGYPKHILEIADIGKLAKG